MPIEALEALEHHAVVGLRHHRQSRAPTPSPEHLAVVGVHEGVTFMSHIEGGGALDDGRVTLQRAGERLEPRCPGGLDGDRVEGARPLQTPATLGRGEGGRIVLDLEQRHLGGHLGVGLQGELELGVRHEPQPLLQGQRREALVITTRAQPVALKARAGIVVELAAPDAHVPSRRWSRLRAMIARRTPPSRAAAVGEIVADVVGRTSNSPR